MTWNYRVIKTTDDLGDWYSIHEVYYEDDWPTMRTEDPIKLAGQSIEEIKDDLEKIAEAFSYPVLIDSKQIWYKEEE